AAPFAEELAFRGVILQGLAETGRPLRAVLISAFLFSAFHLDALGFLGRLELGLLFGFLFLSSRSIWPAIAAHAANNGVASAIFLAFRSQPGPDERFPPPLGTLAFLALGAAAMTAAWTSVAPILRRRASPPQDITLPGPPTSLLPAFLRWGGAALLS